jgi:putative membrane protein
MPVYRILTLQVATFLLLTALLYLPPMQAALLPRRTRRALAHEVAMQQFRQRGLTRKKDRTGILIFVSLAEHYARIVADDGIAARVPQSNWQAAVDALVAHTRDGRIAEGFVAAIEKCGDELAAHFPRTSVSAEELPDRIYVI